MAKGKLSIIKDLVGFLRGGKRWWMLPVFVALLLLGVLLVTSQGSVVAPFIYTLF